MMWQASGYTRHSRAPAFDASGADERNIQLIRNTAYVTTRVGMPDVEKEIDSETVSLKRLYPGWDSDLDGGLVTVAENESHPRFAVTVEDADGNLGTVTIKVITEEQAEK